jgi:hypothetical protein
MLLVGIVLGLAAGLMWAGLWPNTPLHATATDRVDTFAMATGDVDEGIEAVYFLDFLSGDLSAAVIGRGATATGYMLTGIHTRNVIQDMNLDANKNPRFLMVTGKADLNRGGRGGMVQASRAVVYVAEVTTGKVAAYAIPWNAAAHNQGRLIRTPLVPVIAFPIRGAGGAGAAKGKDNAKE